ncbi:MAG: ABC transporter ATP-binding protein [Cyclobacteriaceae bacterium]|nr:ABC transporter ATP-binding protein [Cyclobacteriaceae bacterium]
MAKKQKLLTVSHVTRKYGDDFSLQDIDFTLLGTCKMALAGETGSGKSTLLKIIGGLLEPDEGTVIFQNERVFGPDHQLVPGHPKIAYLSQHFDLPKFLRVEQVLSYSNYMSRKQAAIIFSVCRIDHLLTRKTDQLSGGERQRIAIARLLIAKPKLLLLDEPYSNLDPVLKNVLKAVIDEISTKLKLSVILVSHDSADTLSWADKIIVMKSGKIIQHGVPYEIYEKPVDEYVAGLFGEYTSLSPILLKRLGIKSKHKMIIRPEKISIRKSKSKISTGKIVSVNYFGSHYELEVLYHRNILKSFVSENTYIVGDVVKIEINK